MKQEIEIREYVRTKTGFIGKIISRHGGYGLHYELDVKKEIQDNFMNGIVHEDYIAKHSKNIIDLIEVGDVIEVYKDISKYEVIGKNGKYIETLEDRYVVIEDIKSILTKEQFNQNCYEVEES